MIKRVTLFFVFLILALSCNKKGEDANVIINKSIEVSGGELFKNSIIAFDFRDKHYTAIRNNGKFQYERLFNDSLNVIKDVLNNKGFQRLINNNVYEVTDDKERAYSSSVNSVHYFSVLPYGLNNAAVNKAYLEKVEIKAGNYYKIKVTFNQNGGGEDFDDEFIYWINTANFKVDYLAYSYNENDGKGFRFREAYNERYINGIRFVDYNNYKPKNNKVALESIDVLFKQNDLELLSKIELENVMVNVVSNQ
tara:strand:+ start:13042 stop:13794 length:753 start_codon:yes stop_codon:yes gene_type:complete